MHSWSELVKLQYVLSFREIAPSLIQVMVLLNEDFCKGNSGESPIGSFCVKQLIVNRNKLFQNSRCTLNVTTLLPVGYIDQLVRSRLSLDTFE